MAPLFSHMNDGRRGRLESPESTLGISPDAVFLKDAGLLAKRERVALSGWEGSTE